MHLITKLKPSYLERITKRQYFPEKIIMLRKVKDSGKRGKPTVRWIDSVNEDATFNLPDGIRTVNNSTFGQP